MTADNPDSGRKFAGWLSGTDGEFTAIWSGPGAEVGQDVEELDAPFEEVFLDMASRGFAVESELIHGMHRIFRA